MSSILGYQYTKSTTSGIKLINNSTNVVETDNEVIVDDKYFFPAEKETKPTKKNKKKEKRKNE